MGREPRRPPHLGPAPAVRIKPAWDNTVTGVVAANRPAGRPYARSQDFRRLTIRRRGKDAIQRMFNGAELVDPGVVIISYWRPDSGQPDFNADQVWGYCGVARV